MNSNYERDNFKSRYWLMTGFFLVISLILIYIIISGASAFAKLIGLMIFLTEIMMTAVVYIYTRKNIDRAYKSMEKASDMMVDVIEGREIDTSLNLEEGSVGILYNNFDKLVNMFKEGRKREQSEKEYLRDVMSDISHQLKTPLASMEVFVDLLINDKVQSEEEKKKILTETSNQISRMEWMVLSMLKLARIEAGAVSFNINDVSLKSVLEEVKGGTHYLTDRRKQKLNISCPEDVHIKVDYDWMVEAVINIVKNASDYSGEGEDIDITVEQSSVFTRISIRDHGIGMSEETMTHIFERFYRASSEVSPNSVGIGLSLSRSIIEGMKGRITVDSRLGEGSVFKISFDIC